METTAHLGHTISSYEDYNLRAFVAKVAATNPRAGTDELYRLVRDTMIDEMERNPDAARAVAGHWATNEVNAYLRVEGRAKVSPTEILAKAAHQALVSASQPREARIIAQPPTPQQREQRQRETRAATDRVKAQVIHLTLTMPNGKPMAQCTGEEMEGFGAAYCRIADQLSPSETVGEHFTEEQVRGLMAP